MSDFKFLSEEETSRILYLNEHAGFLYTPNNILTIENEFCFQFDDDEPIVFATGNDILNIQINNTNNANIRFTDNTKTFKIFSRGIQNND